MADEDTVPGMLLRWAKESPDKPAFIFYGAKVASCISYHFYLVKLTYNQKDKNKLVVFLPPFC